jgi:anti-sigma B factor antagonist
MSFIQDIRENNGDIRFAELNEKVKNVMDLLGFNHIYDITDTEQEAIDKYSN